MKKIEILGVKIDDITLEEFLTELKRGIESKSPEFVVKPNAEIVTFAQKDLEFKQILNESFLAPPDGIGLILASKFLGKGLRSRLGGPELMLSILNFAEKNGYRVFFLGSKPEVLQGLVKEVKKSFLSLKISGFRDGYFKDLNEVISQLKEAQADVIFVGMGYPRQEKWIFTNLNKFDRGVFIAEGGSFDFLSKRTRRAPEFIRKIGFEWLFRVILQPWRLGRQLQLFKFIYLVVRERFFPPKESPLQGK